MSSLSLIYTRIEISLFSVRVYYVSNLMCSICYSIIYTYCCRLRYYYHASGLNWTIGDTTLGSRVFALCDLHVDYKENRKLLDGWPDKKYSNDVLVVAGDVTDNMTLLETTLKGLQLKLYLL